MTATLPAEAPGTVKTELPKLNATHRCDSGDKAQAWTVWAGPTEEGTEGFLFFCAHHHRKFELGLMAKGFRMVVDNRHELNPETYPDATS